ncbi:hypothetical protein CR203_10620 [Salipaludibacillus neizhouensis]|uniref:KTSC domain-containing protein n=1 Tax=Salipaludibacillus neizhouensis TaxID=885475 RepID=A0A3A9K8E8_9BACI|nr:KTSC domain-containing protein [Salipaludibacillus neizhouensis]RKL67788.1 hypothetical protein CR203_10620 [Salipaludibacillus neizhouensis]
MEVTELKDDYFNSIGYDDTNKQLHVRFQSGRYVIYYEVRKSEYLGLISNNQTKKFFQEEIEPAFPHDVVNE